MANINFLKALKSGTKILPDEDETEVYVPMNEESSTQEEENNIFDLTGDTQDKEVFNDVAEILEDDGPEDLDFINSYKNMKLESTESDSNFEEFEVKDEELEDFNEITIESSSTDEKDKFDVLKELLMESPDLVLKEVLENSSNELLENMLAKFPKESLNILSSKFKSDIIDSVVLNSSDVLIKEIIKKDKESLVKEVVSSIPNEIINSIIEVYSNDLVSELVSAMPDEIINEMISKSSDLLKNKITSENLELLKEILNQTPIEILLGTLEEMSEEDINKISLNMSDDLYSKLNRGLSESELKEIILNLDETLLKEIASLLPQTETQNFGFTGTENKALSSKEIVKDAIIKYPEEMLEYLKENDSSYLISLILQESNSLKEIINNLELETLKEILNYYPEEMLNSQNSTKDEFSGFKSLSDEEIKVEVLKLPVEKIKNILECLDKERIKNILGQFSYLNDKEVGNKEINQFDDPDPTIIKLEDEEFRRSDIDAIEIKKFRKSNLEMIAIDKYKEMVENKEILSNQEYQEKRNEYLIENGKVVESPISIEILEYVCKTSVQQLIDTYKSDIYNPDYTNKLFKGYVDGEISAKHPLFKELIIEVVNKKTVNPYLGEEKSIKVFKHVGGIK